MPGNAPIYQTLAGFYERPFGESSSLHASQGAKYAQYRSLIKLHSYTTLEDSYFIRLQIPSESKAGQLYDVVIQFIPPTKEVEKEGNLFNYVIQFFSNSPSFIYRYAYLYKEKGFMIDALQEKLDPRYANTPPSQTNGTMKLECDKSLYFAVRFLYEQRAVLLSKRSLSFYPHPPFQKFIADIQSNEESLKRDAKDIEREAIEEGKLDKKKIETFVQKNLPGPKGYGRKKVTPSKATSGVSGFPSMLSPKSKSGGKLSKVTANGRKRKIGPNTSTRKSHI